ncbi:MAG: polyamine aminopropyltransferase, partial [Saprospiraceae bacterium]
MTNTNQRQETIFFFIAVFIAGLCSLIYELLISTTSSYFLGDSVKQFSLTIGIYMAAMGVGSYLTKFLKKDLLEWFIKIEMLLGFVGGASVPILYYVFDQTSSGEYQFVMLALTGIIGALTGFEIPLLVRILKKYFPLQSNLAYVLSLDYIGALGATLLFPFLLLPFVGTFRTSILFGMLNIALGFVTYRFFTGKLSLKKKNWLEWLGIICIAFFLMLFTMSNRLLTHWEDSFYNHRIVYAKQTPYQKLVLTQNRDDLKLYINRIIQFSSKDEYRYHESLAVIPLLAAPYKKKILILGGGEGLLAREVLKFQKVESITIVDLDPEVFRIAKENVHLKELNEGSLSHPKVTLVAQDAMAYLKETDEQYDVILADLPDPSNESVARMYSTMFYRLVQSRLSGYGVFATQATSVFHTNNAFWSIQETLEESGFAKVHSYHTYVPSFGDWGFHLAANHEVDPTKYKEEVATKYLDASIVPQLFLFEKDVAKPEDIEANRLDQP